jgi:chromosome segregation ATPase
MPEKARKCLKAIRDSQPLAAANSLHSDLIGKMERQIKDQRNTEQRLAARVAELEADKARLAVEVDSMRQQAEQARKDRDEATMEAAEAVLGAEAERDRIRELLLEAQSGGDAFRAPQDWWARVALAGPAPEGGAK